MVYLRNDSGDPLFIADRTEQTPTRSSRPRSVAHNHNPVWSPDGQWIYFVHGFVHGLNQSDDMDVWRLRASGGSPERLTEQKTAVTFLAPLDPRTLLYVARAEDRSGPWLWSLDVESKVTRRVSSGLDQYTSVASSHDGKRVVATVARPSANLGRVPLLDRLAEDSDVEAYPLPTARALAPRFGGGALFYFPPAGLDGYGACWTGRHRSPAVATDHCPSRRMSPMGDAWRWSPKGGTAALAIMSAEARTHSRSSASIYTQGRPTATGRKWIVAGGSDASPRLFKIPVRRVPVRLVYGRFRQSGLATS